MMTSLSTNKTQRKSFSKHTTQVTSLTKKMKIPKIKPTSQKREKEREIELASRGLQRPQFQRTMSLVESKNGHVINFEGYEL